MHKLPQQSSQPLPTVSPQASQLLQVPSQASAKPIKRVKPYFGHLPYREDDSSRLVTVGRFVRGTYERSELLDWEAAQAFQQMLTAAQADNVFLMPISGFRSIADQQVLFSEQIQRRGSEEAAARFSAPPGYSEHHTGYAIDVTDQQQPDADLKGIFEATAAYHWLEANAHKYGFEQSFPKNNRQGVSFEPWHWRYVLSSRAAKIFTVAKSLQ
ncbi:M15 family metallopeptidase [Phormidesmis priestleyi]